MTKGMAAAALAILHGMSLKTVREQNPDVVIRDCHDHYRVIEKGVDNPQFVVIEKNLRLKALVHFAGIC